MVELTAIPILQVKNVLQGGPESQVDKWQTPGNADIATISIGGNDVGFFDVLTACVIHAAGSFTQGCDVAINIANQKRNDTLSSDIALALNQIIDKAGRNRAPFRIYHVGYPVFFNADTNSCNDTTFNIWRPEHDPSHRNGGPYLDKALRLKLNQLTVNLNQFLASIADTVNAQYQQKGYTYNPVTFVDPNPHFDNHRFCERDIGTTEVTEPDSNRLDTWLFFRDWPDNTLPVANISSRDLVNNAPGDDSLQASSLPPLPDPGSCKIALGDDSNWDDRILCDMAQAVSNTSDLPYQVYTSGQENAHNAGNFSVLAVAWWLPTRLAKTFHPRTLGQQALKQAVVDVW